MPTSSKSKLSRGATLRQETAFPASIFGPSFIGPVGVSTRLGSAVLEQEFGPSVGLTALKYSHLEAMPSRIATTEGYLTATRPRSPPRSLTLHSLMQSPLGSRTLCARCTWLLTRGYEKSTFGPGCEASQMVFHRNSLTPTRLPSSL